MRPHDQKLLHRALPASSPTRLPALMMPLALAACAEAVPDKGADDGASPNSPPGAPTVLLSPAAPTTTQDVAVVARLGGHLKQNGRPGWAVLGRGLELLQTLAAGWRLAMEAMGLSALPVGRREVPEL